jgi:hypothetical protein
MAKYDDHPVPRGTSHRWEVLISEDEPAHAAAPRRSAAEVRSEHRVLRDVPELILSGIPLLDQGSLLKRRSEYLDLHDPARADFRAEGGEVVRPGQRVVARADVSDEAWQELREGCARVVRPRPLRRAG